MSKFQELDERLLTLISSGVTHCSVLCARVRELADALATRRINGDVDGWRVVDRRLQALRKRGDIAFDRKSGWKAVKR